MVKVVSVPVGIFPVWKTQLWENVEWYWWQTENYLIAEMLLKVINISWTFFFRNLFYSWRDLQNSRKSWNFFNVYVNVFLPRIFDYIAMYVHLLTNIICFFFLYAHGNIGAIPTGIRPGYTHGETLQESVLWPAQSCWDGGIDSFSYYILRYWTLARKDWRKTV